MQPNQPPAAQEPRNQACEADRAHPGKRAWRLTLPKQGVEKWASIIVSAFFLLFFGFILIRYRGFTYILREELLTTPMFGTAVAIYASLLLLCILFYRRLAAMPVAACAAVIFCLALIPRLLCRAGTIYYPQSDMLGYYRMGVTFFEGDYSFITQAAAAYQVPDYVGLGVLYGLIAKAFSPAVMGYQLAFCIATSVSCLLVYLIAEAFYKPAAPIAGLLFAFYPANIVLSQVLTNQHLNVMFALLSIYLLLRALRARRLWLGVPLALLCGVSLLLAQYAHPSTVTTVIAFSLYLAVALIAAIKRRGAWLRVVAVAGAFALGLCGGRGLSNLYFDALGLRSREAELPTCYLSKVVVGLNPDTNGMYSHEDYSKIARTPPEEQNALCMQMIAERTADFPALLRLLDNKVRCMWMYKDTSFGWSIFGLQDLIQAEEDAGIDSPVREEFYQRRLAVQNAGNLLDFFYVAALYLFAFLGVLLRRSERSDDILLLLVVLGWAYSHVLSEIQTRYRYFAMPLLCVFAGIGVYEVCRRLARARQNRRARREEPAPGASPLRTE